MRDFRDKKTVTGCNTTNRYSIKKILPVTGEDIYFLQESFLTYYFLSGELQCQL